MRVVVVEPHGYHTFFLRMYAELLPSLLGTDELDIRYIVRRKLVESTRALLGPGALVESPGVGPVDLGPGNPVGSAWFKFRVSALIRRHAPDVLIFNTLDSGPAQTLFRRLPADVKVGLLHNPHALRSWRPGAGELIACLHRHDYEAMRDALPITTYFSPYFLPEYQRQQPKEDTLLRVAVGGVISFDRRDYELLVQVAALLAARGVVDQVVFDIVGESKIRDGPRLRRLVEAGGLGDFFQFHSGLTDGEFFQRLSDADFICALVHPRKGPYGKGKVSAAYGNSGALGRPLLIHGAVARRIHLPESVCATYEDADDLVGIILSGRALAEELTAPYRKYVLGELAANRDHLSRVGHSRTPERRTPRDRCGGSRLILPVIPSGR